MTWRWKKTGEPVETPKTTHLAGEAFREPPEANAHHAALFERIAPRIRRYFFANVRADEAEDLAQRTLVELERSLREKTYDPSRSFNTWAWLKARTTLAQFFRECGRKKPERLLEGVDPPAATSPESIDEQVDAQHVLEEVRRRLGQEAHDAFVLYYEIGLSQQEIGDILERDRKTVRQRLKDAHTLIRDLLDREDEPPGDPCRENGDEP
jgi:RNA polymerase sigma factor (sigma-70 family)